MFARYCGDSRELLILAVILATLLAQDQNEKDIGKMAAFFTLVGDALALFALQPETLGQCGGATDRYPLP